MIRALTLTQPWAGLVASGVKLVENRSRRAPAAMIGQRFAIHASREINRDTWRTVIQIDPTLALDYPGPLAARGRRATRDGAALMSATCKSCSAPIEWAKAARTGKAMPLDVAPTPDGNLVVIDGLVHAASGNTGRERRTSHFATCPQAASWRQR